MFGLTKIPATKFGSWIQGVLSTTLVLGACSGGDDSKGKQTQEEAPVVQSFPSCEAGEREACGVFTTEAGAELPLGPYGAIMEPNVGVGFENTINPFDADDGMTCAGFSSSFFGEDAEQTTVVSDITDLEFDLYTVYRPARWVDGEKYPIVTWGNGTCAQPEDYGALLRYIASQGFFVVAPNSRWVGSGTELVHALDFAFAANKDRNSPYYQRLDTSKVAALGHSQGGNGAESAAKDVRVKAVVLFNSGTFAVKPFLAISGDTDIGDEGTGPFAAGIATATIGAYLFYHMVPHTSSISGHLTLMREPERVVEPTTAFLKYMLSKDEESSEWFVGPDCKLCGHDAEYEFGQTGL